MDGVYVGASVGALLSDNNDDRGGPSTLSFPAGAGGPGSPFFAINSAGGGGPGVPFGAPVAPLAGVPLPTATVVGLGSVCAGCGNDRDTSLIFGVQVGYNYQFSPGSGFVVGVEADAQFLGEQGSSNRRGGVTGTTLVTPASVGTPPFALGAGFEYAITNNWSVKAEGLYVRIDRDNNNQATGSLPYAVASGPGFPAAGTSTLFYAPATAFSPRGNRNDDDFFILRAGVNYRFGTM